MSQKLKQAVKPTWERWSIPGSQPMLGSVLLPLLRLQSPNQLVSNASIGTSNPTAASAEQTHPFLET